jgi:glycosyltransferase involved in cell wall biosynthesis
MRTHARDVDPYFADADIFHSTFFPFPPAVKRAASVKKFLTIYDLIPILYPNFFEANASIKRLIEEALASLDRRDFLLCISEATKKDLCNYAKNIDPAKVFVTHLAASELFRPCTDLERIAAVRRKYGIPQHGRYLLSLGTLEPRKNMDQVIRSFAKVAQEQNLEDLHLVLVGTKGWEYGNIYKAISDYECLKTRIILTGYVDDDDLSPLYSGALAFIYVSLYEGFGLPPLEAMQCGTPVITSNTSSLPEVVGKAAIMLDPMDTDGICQNMLKLYQDKTLRSEMSQRSLDQARKFSWEKCTRETIAAYRTALSH